MADNIKIHMLAHSEWITHKFEQRAKKFSIVKYITFHMLVHTGESHTNLVLENGPEMMSLYYHCVLV